ncbi:MAG: hypothetical protein JNG53_03715 [Senegalimassilia sp.]|nr:hypothetical protein [Senegalimassilia sp.]
MDFVAAYLHPWDLSERNRVARSGRDYARVEDRWRAKRAAIFASVGVDPVADGGKAGVGRPGCIEEVSDVAAKRGFEKSLRNASRKRSDR